MHPCYKGMLSGVLDGTGLAPYAKKIFHIINEAGRLKPAPSVNPDCHALKAAGSAR